MDPDLFNETPFGRPVRTKGPHGYWYFSPQELPRQLDLPPPTVKLAANAAAALGHLAGIGKLVPNPHLLIQPYISQEALASSRIEGTEASMSDVLEAQNQEIVVGPVREVTNYIKAFEYGLARLDALPVSRRFLCEVHKHLLDGARGNERQPGHVRQSQNWIGGVDVVSARFVPPVVDEVTPLLDDLERYIHSGDEVMLPDLVQLALLHYQFETIHPFLDGNGRLGRLLITFLLVEREILPTPLLYLSAWFERHKQEYYDHLQAVRERGEVIEWVDFFLRGITQMSTEAVAQAEQLVDLEADFRKRLQGDRSRAIEVIDLIMEVPLVTTARIASKLGTSPQTSLNYVNTLVKLEVLREVRSPGRGKRWIAPEVYENLVPGGAPDFA